MIHTYDTHIQSLFTGLVRYVVYAKGGLPWGGVPVITQFILNDYGHWRLIPHSHLDMTICSGLRGDPVNNCKDTGFIHVEDAHYWTMPKRFYSTIQLFQNRYSAPCPSWIWCIGNLIVVTTVSKPSLELWRSKWNWNVTPMPVGYPCSVIQTGVVYGISSECLKWHILPPPVELLWYLCGYMHWVRRPKCFPKVVAHRHFWPFPAYKQSFWPLKVRSHDIHVYNSHMIHIYSTYICDTYMSQSCYDIHVSHTYDIMPWHTCKTHIWV